MGHSLIFEQPITFRCSGCPTAGDRQGFAAALRALKLFIADLPAGVTAPEVDPSDQSSASSLITYSEDNIAVVEYMLAFTLRVEIDGDTAEAEARHGAEEIDHNPDDLVVNAAESMARDLAGRAVRQWDAMVEGPISYVSRD